MSFRVSSGGSVSFLGVCLQDSILVHCHISWASEGKYLSDPYCDVLRTPATVIISPLRKLRWRTSQQYADHFWVQSENYVNCSQQNVVANPSSSLMTLFYLPVLIYLKYYPTFLL